MDRSPSALFRARHGCLSFRRSLFLCHPERRLGWLERCSCPRFHGHPVDGGLLGFPVGVWLIWFFFSSFSYFLGSFNRAPIVFLGVFRGCPTSSGPATSRASWIFVFIFGECSFTSSVQDFGVSSGEFAPILFLWGLLGWLLLAYGSSTVSSGRVLLL